MLGVCVCGRGGGSAESVFAELRLRRWIHDVDRVSP